LVSLGGRGRAAGERSSDAGTSGRECDPGRPDERSAEGSDLSTLPPLPEIESDPRLDAAPWDMQDTLVETPSDGVEPVTAIDLQRDALVWAARALDRIGTACQRASRRLERIATHASAATTLARQPDTMSH